MYGNEVLVDPSLDDRIYSNISKILSPISSIISLRKATLEKSQSLIEDALKAAIIDEIQVLIPI